MPASSTSASGAAWSTELGVDPGPELRAAHDELLSIGTHELTSTSGSDQAGDGPVRPAQLPAPLRGMTSRPEAQHLLDRVAEAGEAGAVAITSIGGMGGIGKTTLAVAWAHSLAPRFPDGQLYLNLRGFDQLGHVMAPEAALHELLRALGAAETDTEDSLAELAARFRGITAGRRLLFLLDNARDADQVRPLLPNSPDCLVIVTSRNQLSSLVVREGAVPVRIDRMTDAQAAEMLSRRLGEVRTGLEPVAVLRLVEAAAGLPLALAIVAARLVMDPDLGLDAVADELGASGAAGARLSAWSAGDQDDDLSSVFDWSYRLLDEATARAFRLLAVHPGPELSLPVVSSITGLGAEETRRVVTELVGASLLERRRQDRLVMHDLLREYAACLLDEVERRDSEARMVGHYVRSTRHAWHVFGRPPVGELDAVAGSDAISAESFEDMAAAVEWYLREREVLTSVLHRAVERGWDRAAANITIDWRPMNQTVDTHLFTYPHAVAGLEAAERTGDPVLRAELHRDVGAKAARLVSPGRGRWHLETARQLYALLGDKGGEANTLRNLAATSPARDDARGYLRDGLALLATADAPQTLQIQQMLRVDLAVHLTGTQPGGPPDPDECREAEALVREALAFIEARSWTYLLPAAAATYARVLLRLERPAEALDVALRGLAVPQSDPLISAALHSRVAEGSLAVGQWSRAADACGDFHAVLAEVGWDVNDIVSQVDLSDAEGELFGPVRRVEAVLAASGADPNTPTT